MQPTTVVDAPADISQDGMTSQVTALHVALHHQPPVCLTVSTAIGKGHAPSGAPMKGRVSGHVERPAIDSC